jgi:hypothetical protein
LNPPFNPRKAQVPQDIPHAPESYYSLLEKSKSLGRLLLYHPLFPMSIVLWSKKNGSPKKEPSPIA